MQENNQRSGLDEVLFMGQKAARATKIVKAASKGATMAGPWGAAIGAAIEGRESIGRLIAVAASVLLVPVLVILMLPSMIFGGLTARAADGALLPVLNDANAISTNMANASTTIKNVLNDGIDDAKTRIAADFAMQIESNYEVVNPYETTMDNNINLILSEYCSAKSSEWKTMSLSDLERVLRDGISELFSFSSVVEAREVDIVDPETGTLVGTITEDWRIYTLEYNGETNIADIVFHLTDEQKSIAEEYAKNLSLFLGDGLYQGPTTLRPIPSIASLGNIQYMDGATSVVYFNQYDERYAHKPYGTDTVGPYGCGPSSMAIVVSSLTGDIVDPAQMAKWAYENGYWCKGHGSYHSLIPGAARAWGLNVEGCSKSEPERILHALQTGKLVVAIMAKGHFTSGGHFIVLRGVQDGKIMVADPASRSRTDKLWDLSLIVKEANGNAGSGGPFWIIGA